MVHPCLRRRIIDRARPTTVVEPNPRSDRLIVLARHGKPDLPRPLPRVAGTELRDWQRLYDDAGIRNDSVAPATLRALAREADVILASDLRRSLESAARLEQPGKLRVEPALREARLPDALPTTLRLPARAFVAIGRIAWLAGVAAASESLAETRQRARRIARQLDALATREGSVLVIGHGTFNRFVASRLRRLGYKGPRALPVGYWSTAHFRRPLHPAAPH